MAAGSCSPRCPGLFRADAHMKSFSAQEAAEYLKIKKPVLIKLAKSRQIPGKKWRGEWRFGKDTLDAFLAGDYFVPIKRKTGNAERYRPPVWDHPMHVFTLREAAEFLRVSPGAIKKDEDWSFCSKKIGKHTRYIKERIIDQMTKEMRFIYQYPDQGFTDYEFVHWYKPSNPQTTTVLTTDEAAKHMGISLARFKEAVSDHAIRFGTVGKKHRFVKERLDDQVKEMKSRVEGYQRQVSHIWMEIGEPYRRQLAYRSEINKLRRYYDNTYTRRSF